MLKVIQGNLIGGLLAMVFLLAPLPLPAQDAPEALVKNVTDEVLAILRDDQEIKAGNRGRAMQLIETKIAPHFDFNRMTGLAVGRPWREASPEQREALSKEFKSLLVRTYANALTQYKDETVEFKPARSSGGDDAIVRSQINRAGAPPIGLEYRLARGDGGEWKVFDVIVDSVSLVTTYRGSFASEVSSGGIDGLLRSLQAKNRNPEREAS